MTHRGWYAVKQNSNSNYIVLKYCLLDITCFTNEKDSHQFAW